VAEALLTEVSLTFHQTDHRCEAGKIASLGGSQWVCFEKRNDAARQVQEPSDVITPYVLPVVVVPAIHIYRPASEETLQSMQHMDAPGSLDDRELGLHLPAQPTRPIPKDRNTETSLAVDKADDPLRS
jgi:hypothetical protein